MNSPTVSQVLLAVKNTLQRPVNHAPAIYTALRNDKPAEAGSSSPVAGHHNKEVCCGCSK